MPNDSCNINDLHQLALSGQPGSEENLFSSLSDMFHLFVRHRVADASDREEIVQSALLKVFNGYRDRTEIRSFAAWAHQVLRNQLIDFYRQAAAVERKQESIDARWGNRTSSQSDPTLVGRLRAALSALTRVNPRHARVLALHYQGYTIEEISERMDVGAGYCRVMLSRARAFIAHHLVKARGSCE